MINLILLLTVTFVAPPVSQPIVQTGYNDPSESSPILSREEEYIFKATNQKRKEHRLSELTLDSQLCQAARLHAENMARLHKMSHTLRIKGQRTPSERLDYVKYEWSNIGENIAEGYEFDKVVNEWMHSPGHRANILGKRFTEIGVGVAKDENGSVYYVQVFAKPKEKRAIRRRRIFQ